MTREEIMNMPAGRELDALVAEKVFGKNIQWTSGDEWTDSYPVDVDDVIVDHYSTDISAAMEVENKIGEGDIWAKVSYVENLRVVKGLHGQFVGSEIIFLLINATAEQRCKAALLATMEVSP